MNDLGMKPLSLIKSRLERLTTCELTALAEQEGIDIPAGLDRIFIVAELLEAAASAAAVQNGAGKMPPLEEAAAIPEPVLLPKQYNITFIEVLIRDPLWAFAFWEIKGADRESREKAPDFGGYCLRVSAIADIGGLPPMPPGPAGQQPRQPKKQPLKQKEDSFTVPIGAADTAWYLGFSPEGGRFVVELCAVLGGKDTALAASRPFTLPKLANPPYVKDALYDNPLIRLSGAEDFQVIRNRDRRPPLVIGYE
ncbi:MAG: DUF4912 domain-containing protein [Spirochaetaceae bacterium]|jgi:hypothetical protein|nr:DUF4912 domain-containing protein [Spirochaetaceae bacterium]